MLTLEFWAAFLAASLLVGSAAAVADSLRRVRIDRRAAPKERSKEGADRAALFRHAA